MMSCEFRQKLCGPELGHLVNDSGVPSADTCDLLLTGGGITTQGDPALRPDRHAKPLSLDNMERRTSALQLTRVTLDL